MAAREDIAPALQAYMLGLVEFDALLAFQRRLHYDVSGDRSQAALILCEHPPLITVGRQGSRAHILLEPADLALRGWRVRWVNRAGGCWLHQPGQLAAYAILPLDRLGLSVRDYLGRLSDVVRQWLADFDVPCEWRDGGIFARDRLLAGLGVAVRDWVSYFGMCLNVHPELVPFRSIRCAPRAAEPMTSLERERHGRVRPSMARERLLEHFQEVFGFSRMSIFTEHPTLKDRSERCRPPTVAARGN